MILLGDSDVCAYTVYMLNAITTSALASLALIEAVGYEPCEGDLTPFWEASHPCECYRCEELTRQGADLPRDGQCLAMLDHDAIRWNRDLRWELVSIMEEEERYAYWRCYERWELEEERDNAQNAQAERDAQVEAFLAAA